MQTFTRYDLLEMEGVNVNSFIIGLRRYNLGDYSVQYTEGGNKHGKHQTRTMIVKFDTDICIQTMKDKLTESAFRTNPSYGKAYQKTLNTLQLIKDK